MPEIEEVSDDGEEGEEQEVEETPAVGQPRPQAEMPQDDDLSKKQNRAEKKARKAIVKTGVKPVPNAVMATMKKQKNMLFVIPNPDVYKSSNGTYVIFGEAKVEDLSGQAQSAAAQEFRTSNTSGIPSATDIAGAGMGSGMGSSNASSQFASNSPGSSAPPSTAGGAAGSGSGSDSGEIQAADVDLVVNQTEATREQAIKALEESEGDIVTAIMHLSG